jgi:PTH1 family peptidyl-tRNA hydrolase
MVADHLADMLHAGRWSRPGPFAYARASQGGVTIHLVKPLTYMNLSGSAVRDSLEMTGTLPERTLIVLDDFQIPFGAVRIRPAGSAGGHRGLESVIASLGTESVPRLRCGIGGEALPAGEGRRDFVLEQFSAGERDGAQEMVRRAADAARAFATEGIGRAMTRYNTT